MLTREQVLLLSVISIYLTINIFKTMHCFIEMKDMTSTISMSEFRMQLNTIKITTMKSINQKFNSFVVVCILYSEHRHLNNILNISLETLCCFSILRKIYN